MIEKKTVQTNGMIGTTESIEKSINTIITESINRFLINERIFDITIDWIKQIYDKYNELIWGGQLPPSNSELMEFKFSNKAGNFGGARIDGLICENTGYNGLTVWKQNPLFPKEKMQVTYRVRKCIFYITKNRDLTEQQFIGVIVHEMCHVYEYFIEPKGFIYSIINGKYDEDNPEHGHGKVFNEQAEKCKKFGINVQRFVTDGEEAKLVNTNYPFYIISYNVAGSKIFSKVKKGLKQSFIEQLQNNYSVCQKTNDIEVYAYTGNSSSIKDDIAFSTKPKGYYWNFLEQLGLSNDLQLIEKIPCEYKKIELNKTEWCKNNIQTIIDYVLPRYYKKYCSSGKVYPDLKLKMKIDPVHTLNIYIGARFNSFLGFDDIEGYPICELDITNFWGELGNALKHMEDEDCYFWIGKHRDDPHWQNVEKTLANIIQKTINEL